MIGPITPRFRAVDRISAKLGHAQRLAAETLLDTTAKRDAAAKGKSPTWIWPPARGERCHRCHRTDNRTQRCALCNPEAP